MTHHHPFLGAEHEGFRDQVRRFVEREVTPNVRRWEQARSLPLDLHRKAAAAGLLQIGFPEACGGVDVPDLFYLQILVDELTRCGSGGVIASLLSHGIACPPIVHAGTAEQQRRFVAPVIAGERIAALAITEPSGGSDVANLQTRAVRDGNDYVVNGSKTFITSGMRADFITTAVRTGEPGMHGVSLLVIEGNSDGLHRSALSKMGWHCSDTATLSFDQCRVPASNMIGPENAGFAAIMMNFNQERLMLATQACGFAQRCYDECLNYAAERHTFGRALIQRQVIRHKLVDMRMRIQAARAQLDLLTWRVSKGQLPIADVCLLKNNATETLEWLASEAMQILGGAGYLEGSHVERIYRETKVLTIGGGSREIMKDLAARQLGY